MVTRPGDLFWKVPLTVIACIGGSLAVVWVVSRLAGFAMNPAIVVVLSAVLSAAAVGVELRNAMKDTKRPAA
jgi:hypothetical protein